VDTVLVPVGGGGLLAGLAALLAGAYRPRPGERIAVVLSGANTDPADLRLSG
jgi:threonine dehydratase